MRRLTSLGGRCSLASIAGSDSSCPGSSSTLSDMRSDSPGPVLLQLCSGEAEGFRPPYRPERDAPLPQMSAQLTAVMGKRSMLLVNTDAPQNNCRSEPSIVNTSHT